MKKQKKPSNTAYAGSLIYLFCVFSSFLRNKDICDKILYLFLQIHTSSLVLDLSFHIIKLHTKGILKCDTIIDAFSREN